MSRLMKIIKSLILLAIHLAMCMLGYTLIEKWAPLTAFRAAIHTLFPFGYVNIYMFSQVGFKFNTVMSILGIGVLIYVISNVASLIMEGRLKSLLKVGQMDKKISRLKSHYIICGAGEICWFIMGEFLEANLPFIVIDKNQEFIDELTEKGIMALKGDSSDNKILEAAGIKHAKGLLAIHSTDLENLLTVMSSRQMNPDMRIIAAVTDNANRAKFKRFGTDTIIPVSEVTGRRIAAAAVHPTVTSFFDIDGRAEEGISGSVIEIELEQGSCLVDRPQKSSNMLSKTGATILCMIRGDEIQVNPGLNERFREKDRLLVFGTIAQINEFKKLACPGDSASKEASGLGLSRESLGSLFGKWQRRAKRSINNISKSVKRRAPKSGHRGDRMKKPTERPRVLEELYAARLRKAGRGEE